MLPRSRFSLIVLFCFVSAVFGVILGIEIYAVGGRFVGEIGGR